MRDEPGSRAEFVVGVAGPSGAGKSLVAELLSGLHAGRAAVLHEDAYCRDQSHVPWPERADVNMDHPEAIDHALLAAHIAALRQGPAVASPRYDYATFSRLPGAAPVAPRPLLVVEGLLVLSSDLVRGALDLGVYVDAPLDLCLHRRLTRDAAGRGLGVAHTLRQYPRTIRSMYTRFVEPSRIRADVVLSNDGTEHDLRAAVARLQTMVRAAWAAERRTERAS
ncbi:MAG TPA: uridine kinase [Methylomirabilota bacterium]|nr:uridine kinase [Methylomirabilota bacterium]